MVASQNCCRFGSRTFVLRCDSLVLQCPGGALLNSELVIVEAIELHWTHCHVHAANLRWLVLCDLAHYHAIWRCVNRVLKGMCIWSATILRYLKKPVYAKKPFATPFHPHQQPELLTKVRLDPWIHAVEAEFSACILQQKSRFVWPASSAQQFQVSVSLFLPDRSGTWFGLRLLEQIHLVDAAFPLRLLGAVLVLRAMRV